MASNLQELRKSRDFKSARDFAEAAGIPANTYARYESKPESIPLERACQIADELECSLDEVYGREAPDTADRRGEFQKLYDSLSEDSRSLMDQLMAVVRARDAAARRVRRSAEEREYEGYARYYERLFTQEAETSDKLGDVVIFGSAAQKRAAFADFVERRAGAARVGRLDGALAAEKARLSAKYGFTSVDADGKVVETGKRDPKAFYDMGDELDRFRAEEDARLRDEEAGTVSKIVAAYDRLHPLESHGKLDLFIPFDPVAAEYDTSGGGAQD